jgi:hypothetical protein
MNNIYKKINLNLPNKLSTRRNNSTKLLKKTLYKDNKIEDELILNQELSNKFYDNNYKKEQKKTITNNLTQIDNTNQISSSRSSESISIAIANKKINDTKLIYALKTLNLENLFNNFDFNSITFNDLCLLSKDDLIEMNLPIGPRNRILHFAKEYKNYAKNYDINELINFFQSHKQFIINTINDFHFNFLQNKNEDSEEFPKNFNDIYFNSNFNNINCSSNKSNDNNYLKNNYKENGNYLNSIPLPKNQKINYRKIKKTKINNDLNLNFQNINYDNSLLNNNIFGNKKITPTFSNINNNNNNDNSNKINQFSNSYSNSNINQIYKIKQFNNISRNNTNKNKYNNNKTNQTSLLKLSSNNHKIRNRSLSSYNSNNTNVLKNFQNLSSEIETFQNKYQNMKKESKERKNYITELLSKSNINIK